MKSASLVKKIYKRFMVSFISLGIMSIVFSFFFLQARLYEKKMLELENFVKLFETEFNQKMIYYEDMSLQINAQSNLVKRMVDYEGGKLSESEVYVLNNEDLRDALEVNKMVKGIYWFDRQNQAISAVGAPLERSTKESLLQFANDSWIGPFRDEEKVYLAYVSAIKYKGRLLGRNIVLFSTEDMMTYFNTMSQNLEGFEFLMFVKNKNANNQIGEIDRFGVDKNQKIIQSIKGVMTEEMDRLAIHQRLEDSGKYIGDYMVTHKNLNIRGQKEAWHILLGVNRAYISKVVYEFIYKTLILMALCVLVVAVIIWKVLEPIMGKLIMNEQDLEMTIKENLDQLNKSWEIIHKTKNQLIEANRQKALSRLVQGLAHKINTPMGVVLTANTFSKDLLANFEQEVEVQAIKKSDLIMFIESIKESVELVDRNASSIIDLIVKLKYLSEDHDDKRSTIYLKDTIMIIIDGLHKEIEKNHYEVSLNCSDLMTYHGYTEDFLQIVSNLIMNAITHGMRKDAPGMIFINIFREDEQIVMEFTDNGKGIPKENMDKIFEPYFTTSFGQGNGGLGLYIVESIVESSLKGSIKCFSVPDEKTTFIIKFPA